MKVTLISFLLFLSSSSFLTAQRVNKDFDLAKAYIEVEEYANAIKSLNLVINRSPKQLEALLLLGDCQNRLKYYKDAAYTFRGAIRLNNESIQAYDGYASALRHLGQYKEAKNNYYRLTELDNGNEKYKKLIQACDSALLWQKEPQKYHVRNLKQLNSVNSDIAPMWSDNGLVFSSSRTGTIIKRRSGQTNELFFDLYETQTKKNMRGWDKPHPFATEINSPNHEGAACFSSDGKTIYFTRSQHTQGENLNHDENANRLKLYRSQKQRVGWSTPEWFSFNDSSYSYGHPHINVDENVFFFVSEMPGGFGGTDIYMCLRVSDTSWSKPVNLGPEINSSANELYPYFDNNYTLYFSSNGHIGMGGYDIYMANLYDGKWIDRENMKVPINSSYDEFSFIIDNHDQGMFSSNRIGGQGKEDLYQFRKN